MNAFLFIQAINIWLDKATVSMKTYFGQFGRSIDKLYAARLSTSTFLNDILLCGEAWAQSQGHCHGLCSEQTTNIRRREFDAADNEFHTNVDTFLRTHTHTNCDFTIFIVRMSKTEKILLRAMCIIKPVLFITADTSHNLLNATVFTVQ